MLLLGRRPGERIMIGDDIELMVIQVGRDKVRFSIDAPKSVEIKWPGKDREEKLDDHGDIDGNR